MRIGAKRMACCRSLSLRATAWPPSERERDEDGDHGGDRDRGAQIHPGGERRRPSDRGRERLPEGVDVTAVAGREDDPSRDERGAAGVRRRRLLVLPKRG